MTSDLYLLCAMGLGGILGLGAMLTLFSFLFSKESTDGPDNPPAP